MENAVRDLASQVGLWLKWIDGNLDVGVEIRVIVGMENHIVDVCRSASLQQRKQGPDGPESWSKKERKEEKGPSGKNKRPSTTNQN